MTIDELRAKMREAYERPTSESMGALKEYFDKHAYNPPQELHEATPPFRLKQRGKEKL